MLGLALLATAPLSDDGDRLPRIQTSAVGQLTLGGNARGGAKTAGVSPLAMLAVTGASGSISRISARGLRQLDVSEDARGLAQLLSGVAATIALARQLEAEAVVGGAAAHGIRLDGATKAAVQSRGIGTDIVILAGRAAADAVAEVAVDRVLGLDGDGHVETATKGRVTEVAPALSGFAGGATLEARFGNIAGCLSLGFSARAALEALAIADAVTAISLDVFGTINARSVIAGDLYLARNLNAGLLATGDASREISVTGTASGLTVTAADVAAAGMEFTGTRAGKGAGLGSIRHELAVFGGAKLASFVTGGATTECVWAGASRAATGSGAGVEEEVSLQGETATANSIYAFVSTSFSLSSQIAGAGRLIARMDGKIGVAVSGSVEVSSLGKAHSVIGVARKFAGDVDVVGDSAPAITTVDIDADASRLLEVHGYSEGQILIAGDPRPLRLGLNMHAVAASAAAGTTRSDMITAGSAASQAKSLASGKGRLLLDRTGSGDVLVQGEALRGMHLFGVSAIRTTGLAAANSIVAPNLSASAANVIHLEFTSEAIAPDGGGVGSNLAAALGISARWDLHTTAIAYRAPPALRRSEPAKYGLSGRLTPSNSGLVLRR